MSIHRSLLHRGGRVVAVAALLFGALSLANCTGPDEGTTRRSTSDTEETELSDLVTFEPGADLTVCCDPGASAPPPAVLTLVPKSPSRTVSAVVETVSASLSVLDGTRELRSDSEIFLLGNVELTLTAASCEETTHSFRMRFGGSSGATQTFTLTVESCCAADDPDLETREIGDTEFEDPTWEILSELASEADTTHAANRTEMDGDPDAYRAMTHILAPPTGDEPSSHLSVVHRFLGTDGSPGEPGPSATHDPATQGAVSHLDFRWSEILTYDSADSQGAAVGRALAVAQTDPDDPTVVRRYLLSLEAFTNRVWEQHEVLCLQASDFEPQGLDFSSAGGPLSFGFARSNSTNLPDGRILAHGMDNFTVVVHHRRP